MWDVISWLFFIVFIAGLIIVGGLLLRGYLSGNPKVNPFTSGLFAQKPDRRLDVVEQANLDGRRKLVLVRRDNVEHLIMTGGPVDIVLETGIDPRKDLRSAVDHGRQSASASAAVASAPGSAGGRGNGDALRSVDDGFGRGRPSRPLTRLPASE